MIPTAEQKSFLSREDVCLIMEAGSKAGVVELKFHDLHITFGKPAEQQIVGMRLPYPFVQQPSVQSAVTDLTEDQHNQQTKASVEKDEITLKEERLARLLVEDPAEYERLLRDGELSNDVDDSDDEE